MAGDPRVLGTNLRLNDKVRTVVGVMPPRFMWRGADVYLPIVFQRGKFVEGVHYVNVIGQAEAGCYGGRGRRGFAPDYSGYSFPRSLLPS